MKEKKFMDDKKLNSFNETALSSFNKIKQKHGFVPLTGQFDASRPNTSNKTKTIDADKIEKVINEPIPTTIKEIVAADRVFDILRYIDEQSFSNNIKAALGIILSGERNQIEKAIEYLEKEIK
jgi:hypothetical protein